MGGEEKGESEQHRRGTDRRATSGEKTVPGLKIHRLLMEGAGRGWPKKYCLSNYQLRAGAGEEEKQLWLHLRRKFAYDAEWHLMGGGE